jgi:hypothetical protein
LSIRHLLLLTAAAPACVGCGSSSVPVRGVLRVDGKPLTGAFVTFNAQDPGCKDAHGSTDADGAFRLSTVRPGDGVMPGFYKITVQYSEPVAVPPGLKSLDEIQRATAEAAASRKQSLVLPAIYTQPDKTVLKHKVPDDGDVKLDLRTK